MSKTLRKNSQNSFRRKVKSQGQPLKRSRYNYILIRILFFIIRQFFCSILLFATNKHYLFHLIFRIHLGVVILFAFFLRSFSRLANAQTFESAHTFLIVAFRFQHFQLLLSIITQISQFLIIFIDSSGNLFKHCVILNISRVCSGHAPISP